MTRAAVVLLVVAGVSGIDAATGGATITREVYLMGTRAQLATRDADRAAGLQTLERALRILEATEAELSTWRDDSVVSRLNRHPIGEAFALPHELCGTFAALYEWHAATAGTFDPAIGRTTDVWGIHAAGRVPPDHILREARARSGLGHLAFDRDRCSVTRREDVTLDVGAFGKGDALDRVARSLADMVWMIDLGGQVSAHAAPGHPAWRVAIAHPRQRDRELLHVNLREGSLSTSGASERDLLVDGRRVGHILDPRTGAPAPFDGSVVVWHRDGLAADILSTALYVMGPEAGLAYAEGRALAACYLIPGPGGTVRVSPTAAFRQLLS